jgi:hypothetical protein
MSARFAAGYEACREEVAEQIRAVWTTGPVGLDPAVTAWIDSVRRLRDRRAATPPLPSGPAGSPLAWHIYALPDTAHAVGAVVLRCTHLMSNRMGIAMAEEIGGGYEVARALTDRALAGRAGAR